MPPQPPSFGSQQYWDARFSSNSSPFEWLEAPTALDPYLVSALQGSQDKDPELLHIGCGTSLLSYHLRAHVKDPERIHNLDYSDVAIQVGRKREIDIYSVQDGQKEQDGSSHAPVTDIKPSESPATDGGQTQPNPTPSEPISTEHLRTTKYMRWSPANLLSHTSLLDVCKPSTYSIIVDKSTSDSIACSEDLYVPLPYPVASVPDFTLDRPASERLSRSPEPIHPLHILAIHMALLTKPKARWISLSYSEDRYPFVDQPMPAPRATAAAVEDSGFASPSSAAASAAPVENGDDEFDDGLDDDLDDITQEVIDSGMPDPGTLWQLEEKYEIEAPSQIPPNGNPTVHRPKILHWVYVLRRTDVQVFVR